MVSSISGSSGLNAIQQLMFEFQKKMQSANTDGKTGLSKDELASINTGSDQGSANFLSVLTKNFDKLDTNGDGQLSQNEIQAARPAHKHHHMGPPPGMMMDSLASSDTDGTSGLSKDELSSINTGTDKSKADFISNIIQNFDTLDTNKDGQVSLDELMPGNTLSKSSSDYMLKLLSNYQDYQDDSDSDSSGLSSTLNISA